MDSPPQSTSTEEHKKLKNNDNEKKSAIDEQTDTLASINIQISQVNDCDVEDQLTTKQQQEEFDDWRYSSIYLFV